MVIFFNDCKDIAFDSQDPFYATPQAFSAYCFTAGIDLPVWAPPQTTTTTTIRKGGKTTTVAGGSGGNDGSVISTSNPANGVATDSGGIDGSNNAGHSGTGSGSVSGSGSASTTQSAGITPTTSATATALPDSSNGPLGVPIAGWVGIGVGGLLVLIFLGLFITRLCNKSRRLQPSRGAETSSQRGGNDAVVSREARASRNYAANTDSRDVVRDSSLPREPPRAMQQRYSTQNQNHAFGGAVAGSREVTHTFDMTPAATVFAAAAASEQPSKTQQKEPTRLIDLDDDDRSITSSQRAPSFFDVYSNPTAATTSVGPAYSNPSLSQQPQHRASLQYPAVYTSPLASNSFSNVYESRQVTSRHMSMPPGTSFESVYSSQTNTQQHRNSFADAPPTIPQRPQSLQQTPFTQVNQVRPVSYAVAPPTSVFANQANTKDPFNDSASAVYNRPTSFAEAYSKPINRESFLQRTGSNPFDDTERIKGSGERQSFMDVYSQSGNEKHNQSDARRDSFVDVYGRF
ncbi:UNVERIFIED_CONTAM: hypothetical protein HDU68_012214 [Siphonaria sp. JEL0065]|nr:hypothetical protein HDU68_012214 [Siphonaria sp. JEL0065]